MAGTAGERKGERGRQSVCAAAAPLAVEQCQCGPPCVPRSFPAASGAHGGQANQHVGSRQPGQCGGRSTPCTPPSLGAPFASPEVLTHISIYNLVARACTAGRLLLQVLSWGIETRGSDCRGQTHYAMVAEYILQGDERLLSHVNSLICMCQWKQEPCCKLGIW